MGLVKQIVWTMGGRVISGPFKGLRFRTDSVCGLTGPKILGTYELELHEVIQELIAAKPVLIVDVGAAEGYYAVGLARAIPLVEVIAFEVMAEGRDLLDKVAGENGVRDRIRISGLCTEESLRSLLNQRQVEYLIMDVEGAEVEILTDALVPLLHKTRLLVEIHDFVNADIAPRLRHVFEHSHLIREIAARPRRLSDVSNPIRRIIVALFHLLGRDYLRERPPGMRWFWMVPKV